MRFRVLVVFSAIVITVLGNLPNSKPPSENKAQVVEHDAYTILVQTYPMAGRAPSY